MGVCAVAVEANRKNEKCEAASQFYDKCNKCRCANDGSGSICTRKQCIPGRYDENGALIEPYHEISKRSSDNLDEDYFIILGNSTKSCDPTLRYKLDCHTCVCNRAGRLICNINKFCPESEKQSVRIDYPDLPEGSCEFGKTYKKDCNTCFCGKMGVTACTMKDCGADVVYYNRKSRSANEKWGPRYEQGNVCEPGKKFFSECNECICNTDSKSAVCTLKMCPPHHDE
ncbi:hypothetical protein PV326_007164 [Microctonus aethiopoides]|nr:hypothetical protein PV326_007164 [Microctonus aethiopoides]